jgi:hypothetical protein
MAQSRGESALEKEDQLKVLKTVSKNGPDWKLVADELNFKNRREAIIEFLRIPLGLDSDLEKDFIHELD